MDGKLYWNKLTMVYEPYPGHEKRLIVQLTIPYVLFITDMKTSRLTELLKLAIRKRLEADKIAVYTSFRQDDSLYLTQCPHYKVYPRPEGPVVGYSAATRTLVYKVNSYALYRVEWDWWYSKFQAAYSQYQS